MPIGKIIVEIYERTKDATKAPSFEFIPCDLNNCLKKGKIITLKDIIEAGFEALPKKFQNSEKRQEIMEKMEEADIGRIAVAYHAPHGNSDPFIELTNITQISIESADARRIHRNNNEIILYGCYRLSNGNEKMKLKDSQRMTLVYSNDSNSAWDPFGQGVNNGNEAQKEIQLNITYLQD